MDRAPYDPMSVVFTSDASSAEVLAFYCDQCAESESVLATAPLLLVRLDRVVALQPNHAG